MSKTIAVIFGGKSAEHDVSIITAHIPIIDSLKAAGNFHIWPIYITKEGDWYSDKAMNDLKFFKQPDYEAILKKQKKLQLSFDNGLTIIWPGFHEKKVKIDVVFTAMHGTYGEDGSLMGFLRMANVPFVGSDMTASAVAMDKAFTKQVLEHEGVPVVPFVWFTKKEYEQNKQLFLEKIARLKYPLFVKPVHLGSSIGMTKVKNAAELENAIEVALHYDDKVLVEEGVENLIEVTLPIMGNDELTLASVERPLNKTEFFDFKDKYLSGGKKGGGVNNQYSEIPANIGDDLTKQVQELGKRTYKILGCAGTARVDFLIDDLTKKVFVNEVNLLPGSLYAHNWKKSGVSGVELVTKLIALAEERFSAEQKLTHTFSSDILSKVGGPKVQ
ncbi:MAG: D-alanine--D-alanine ligase [Candidatus Taylorbacteria bacterium CG11_big_fil_rev_8_21_14_0_20_46_11]|uniref:D-alanine--D-alanine ligase n=1 Tax=Candidatus Taylorbacteria bacterium CG11_big_fil_rev_8_21_14_0_20_46_11 TaxID=1975025 RepID=A0A2H0KCL8_9BACT|nr:MAG: D-alanine--D-alanine ligase [Candidatus Taylorbacteria bacterium CG11_big_fil_rev_8_21_14_0_20_46_11]